MELIGQSPSFLASVKVIQKIARHDVTALIEGETGTGKELAARAIHYQSSRAAHAFVPVNCGALPDSLLESELFGHCQGTFTDAKRDRQGLIALAHQGTLFLDEIDSLSPKAQVALLRFLQDRRFRPLGARAERSADVRVLGASNRDLIQLAASGEFRTDLLYRIRVLHVRIPPLRERAGDVRLLAEHFLAQCARRHGGPIRQLAQASDWIERYGWPGNVRELENCVQRSYLMCETDEVELERPPSLPCTGASSSPIEEHWSAYSQARMQALREFNRKYLMRALARTGGNVSRAAQLSGKDRRSFSRLLKRYNVLPRTPI